MPEVVTLCYSDLHGCILLSKCSTLTTTRWAHLALQVLGGDVDTGVAQIGENAGELHAVPDPE